MPIPPPTFFSLFSQYYVEIWGNTSLEKVAFSSDSFEIKLQKLVLYVS